MGTLRTLSFLLLLPLAACGDDFGEDSQDADESAAVRIVEAMAAGASGAFIEVRNDGVQAVSLDGWAIGSARTSLRHLTLDSAEARRGQAGKIPPGGLGLIVEPNATPETIWRMACEAPIQTTQASLGSAHAAINDPLATTLAIQQARHCIPVFTVTSGELRTVLGTPDLPLIDGDGKIRDRARATWGTAPNGVGYERTGRTGSAFTLSPIGATPGARNFFSFDAAGQDAPRAMRVLAASPWRVGDEVIALRRKAAQAGGGEAEALLAKAHSLEIGAELPANPLLAPFDDLVSRARKNAFGAFYQLNDPHTVEALSTAKLRGVDVRVTTDAEFKEDPHYTEGFKKLRDAGVPIAFDSTPDGRNRAPLMHNKFLTVDGEWLWTGSFNPVEDEPARIHADNVLRLRSPGLATVHQREYELLASGKFGTAKRSAGVGGGSNWINGARVDYRFSPGITVDQLKRRGNEYARSQDVALACQAKANAQGALAIEERYRSLDPCGGPYDLITGELARATSSIYFVAFSLSLDDAVDVMLERHEHGGVDVKGVVDPTVSTKGAATRLIAAGADVRATPNSDPSCPAYVKPKTKCPNNPNKVWLHHKFVLIDYGTDHPAVITGSHNMSDGAEQQNDETLLVVRDRAVVEQYYRIFRDVYDHPQTLGPKRDLGDLPALAITEVRPASDAQAGQYAVVENFGDEPAELDELMLWNRRTAAVVIDSNVVLPPGGRVVLSIGQGTPDDALPTVLLEVAGTEPFIAPTNALVLQSKDGRWIATYDPYTSVDTLPEGEEPRPGDAWQLQFDRGDLEAFEIDLVGVNTTPDQTVPTWNPRGLFSDWADEHDVARPGLVLMKAVTSAWTPITR